MHEEQGARKVGDRPARAQELRADQERERQRSDDHADCVDAHAPAEREKGNRERAGAEAQSELERPGGDRALD